jgi:hypothetical protein
MLKTSGLLAVLVFSVSFSFEKISAQDASNSISSLIITEIRLGGDDIVIDDVNYKEFISIYNQSDETIDFDNEFEWILEYAKSSFIPNIENGGCEAPSWHAQDTSNAKRFILSGSIEPKTEITISGVSLTDSKGGSIRILEQQINGFIVHDMVGWDNNESIAPCLDNQEVRKPASWPIPGKSIQRYFSCDLLLPKDTNNNTKDFAPSDNSSPGVFAGPLEKCGEPVPVNSCAGIIISELLPNPAGADSGKEFIELHNTTYEKVRLEGCKLEYGTSSFMFRGEELNPGEYKAFYDGFTGITLVNSSKGIVYLVDTNDNELAVEYPAGLGDDVAWALFGDDWAETFIPMPNSVNELLEFKPCPDGKVRNPETNICVNIAGPAAGWVPCNQGQKRNPDTNRCRNIASLSSVLKACKPGQERNPDTNRCRGAASLASTLKACSSDQIRNPETNRCKKVTSSSLKPCKKGQERNPDTNRCRNTSGVLGGVNGINSVQDVQAPPANTQGLILAAGSVAGALFYGLWEWRNEAILGLMNLKKKLLGAS